MSPLAVLEAQYDGPLPPAARALAVSLLSQEEHELLLARMQAIGCRQWVRTQIRAIRSRRADGSAYPALIDDLGTYRRAYCAAMLRVTALRSSVADERGIAA